MWLYRNSGNGHVLIPTREDDVGFVDDVDKLTKVHLRYPCDTKVIDMAPRVRRPCENRYFSEV